MQIISLSEGSFTIDKTKLFVPFNEDGHDLQARPVGSLLVEIQPFLIITSKDILLLDTGLGFVCKDSPMESFRTFGEQNGQLQIHKNLLNAGIDPNDITKVLLTHLHKDHSGGVSSGDDHALLSFPNAIYYAQEKELAFAFEKGLPSFIPQELTALKNSSQVVLLKEDEGIIDNYIQYKITGAHSPFHQVFWIRENGQTVFFGGDDAPQLQQMKHRFTAKYDFNGKLAMELRREWWHRGQNEKWTFLFYHDVKNPVVRF